AGEVEEVLKRARVTCVRSPSLVAPGAPSGLYICKPQGYGFEAVSRKQRAHVRAGLDRCEVRAVDPDELEREGLELNTDTMKRQSRYDPEFGDPRNWKRFVDAVRQSPAITVRGAYLNGRLSAYTVLCREEGWLQMLVKMSRTADLAHSTNHALDFSVLSEAGRDPSIRAVGNWYSSGDAHSGLDRYKRNMGFETVPFSLSVRLHPNLAPLVTSRAVFIAIKAAQSVRPQSDFLRKAKDLLDAAVLSRPQSPAAVDPCQHEAGREYSRISRPKPVFLACWYLKQLRQRGIAESLRMAPDFLSARLFRRRKQLVPRPAEPCEVLSLQPGEWVEVKGEDEILSTLDKRGKNRGLLLTNEMRPYFGRKFRVFKRVERIYLEESRQKRKLKNTVLLEGLYCSGAEMECDKACFLFWKEVWLRRTTPPPGLVDWQGTRVTLVSLPAIPATNGKAELHRERCPE
ncbi:MAG: hypothetical protein Q8N47_26275, partial [Bryobacterales bacterium]|nr:hypothetical protein [Bryobacterales bacterium]